jgi:dienelactone hydrolase
LPQRGIDPIINLIRPGAGESVTKRICALLGAISLYFSHSAFAAEPATPLAASRTPSIAELAADPVMLDPAMAPDGHRIAALIAQGEHQSLALIDADARDFPTRMLALPGDESVDWVTWAGPHRLIACISGPDMVQLVAVDVATLAQVELGRGREGFERDDLIHVDPAGRYLLLSVRSGRKHAPSIYRIDLATGARSQIVRAQDGVDTWLADNDGVVRAGVATHGNRRWTVYRALEGERFRRAVHRGAEAEDAEQMMPAAGTDQGYAMAPYHGRLALYRYDFRRDSLGALVHADPHYDLDGFALASDGTLQSVAYTADHDETYWFDPRVAALQRHIDARLPGLSNQILSISDDRSRLFLLSSSPSEPGKFYLFDAASNKLRLVAEPFPRLHDKLLPMMQPVHYAARDGLAISGYLTLPPGRPAKGLPLIVMPHGGPFARDVQAFDPWVAYLAGQGYAVLQPNFRGSTGFGEDFVAKGDGQWGRGMQDDIDDAVQWAATQGIADPKRVCIMGASFGGYAALWAAVRNADRYRCAISFAGVSDVAAQLKSDRPTFGSTRDFDDWRKRIQGTSPSLDKLSPLRFADRVGVPVLIAHGQEDDNVPVAQSIALDRALTKFGRPHELVVYPHEGHGLREPAHTEDFLTRVGAFLAKYNPS